MGSLITCLLFVVTAAVDKIDVYCLGLSTVDDAEQGILGGFDVTKEVVVTCATGVFVFLLVGFSLVHSLSETRSIFVLVVTSCVAVFGFSLVFIRKVVVVVVFIRVILVISDLLSLGLGELGFDLVVVVVVFVNVLMLPGLSFSSESEESLRELDSLLMVIVVCVTLAVLSGLLLGLRFGGLACVIVGIVTVTFALSSLG